MNLAKIDVFLVILFATACCGLVADPMLSRVESAESHIVILSSQNEAPYRQAADGFTRFLSSQNIKATYAAYRLSNEPSHNRHIIEKIKMEKPDLLFTLGSSATEVACGEMRVPVVSSFIVNADPLRRCPNATGVYLEYPVETQLRWMKRILPVVRSVAVLYNRDENGSRIQEAMRSAKSMGLRLHAFRVDDPKDIPEALNKVLDSEADVLWGMSDRIVINSNTARQLILFSFRNKLPLVGPSQAWVKAGALYALERDYDHIGMQCGEIALRVLEKTRASSIAPSAPKKVIYYMNSNSFSHFQLKISEAVMRGAHEIY